MVCCVSRHIAVGGDINQKHHRMMFLFYVSSSDITNYCHEINIYAYRHLGLFTAQLVQKILHAVQRIQVNRARGGTALKLVIHPVAIHL